MTMDAHHVGPTDTRRSATSVAFSEVARPERPSSVWRPLRGQSSDRWRSLYVAAIRHARDARRAMDADGAIMSELLASEIELRFALALSRSTVAQQSLAIDVLRERLAAVEAERDEARTIANDEIRQRMWLDKERRRLMEEEDRLRDRVHRLRNAIRCSADRLVPGSRYSVECIHDALLDVLLDDGCSPSSPREQADRIRARLESRVDSSIAYYDMADDHADGWQCDSCGSCENTRDELMDPANHTDDCETAKDLRALGYSVSDDSEGVAP